MLPRLGDSHGRWSTLTSVNMRTLALIIFVVPFLVMAVHYALRLLVSIIKNDLDR